MDVLIGLSHVLCSVTCLVKGRRTNLALDEHVEEVVAGFLVISVAH